MENMGDRLKRLRLEHNMTQEEIGKVLGVQKAAINKYEKGNVENIKRSSILKLAKLYKVKPSYILCFDEETDDMMDNASLLYNQLDSEDRAEIRGEMKQMLKAPKYNKTSLSSEIADDITKLMNMPTRTKLK